MNGTLTDIAGILVGHWTDMDAATGCTVILCPPGTVGGVDVRGSAPGTRETDLLNPVNLVQQVDAVLLGGGAAYGLAAADGVMRWLEEHGRGFDTGVARVPIVPAAIIFDLALGRSDVRPDSAAGYAACQAASAGPVTQGNVGAGTGATIAKAGGLNRAMKGGLGSASFEVAASPRAPAGLRAAAGLRVAALAVVNALGEVRDPATGRVLAGIRQPQGGFADPLQVLLTDPSQTFAGLERSSNTTLVVVATNAALTKVSATKVAQMAQDGLARVIRPAHTMFDGDTIFALSAGDHAAETTLIGALAAEIVSQAVINAILAARGLAGTPSAWDLTA